MVEKVRAYISNADERGEDERSDPMHVRWSQGCPREAEEADGF